MANQDDFKRASLRGRGWKILKGEEARSSSQIDMFTPEEIEALLDQGFSLGLLPVLPETPRALEVEMMDEPEVSVAEAEALMNLEMYEFELLPTDAEQEAMPDETFLAPLANEITHEEATALDFSDEMPEFEALLLDLEPPSFEMEQLNTLEPAPSESAFMVSPLDESEFISTSFDAAPELIEEPLLIDAERKSEIFPPMFDNTYSDQLRQAEAALQSAIEPFEPHSLEDEAFEQLFFDEPELQLSEGIGPSGGVMIQVEGMPLVEDIERPQIVDLQGKQRPLPERIVPRTPEVASQERLIEDNTASSSAYIESHFESPQPLLEQFVSDARLQELWSLIEDLQEEIANQTIIPRNQADIYEEELLRATDLLLQSRQNYDDARAIAYRVRANLNRDRRVEQDIKEHQWKLLFYLFGWALAIPLLALFEGLAKNVADGVDVAFFGAAYLPTLFGTAGGVFLAYSTLHKHVSIRRDFDPIHIPWYIFAPLVGGLMGFLAFMLWMAALLATIPQELTDTDDLSRWPVLIWIVAFIAGLQQNWIINRLRALRESLSADNL